MAEVTDGFITDRAAQSSILGRTAQRAGVLAQYAGAAISVALIAGVGVWGYKLFVRDVTGVPVVRAMEGPMRQAPADPGGDLVQNTGLSVNAVAAEGGAAAAGDVLVLAPASNGLAAEDMDVQSTAEAGEVLATDPPPVNPVALLPAGTDPLAQGTLSQAALETDPDAVAPAATTALAALSDTPLTAEQVLALADQIAAGATPLTELASGTDVPAGLTIDGAVVADAAVLEADAALTLIPESVPGVSVSLRPSARPQALSTSAESVPETATPVVLTTAAIPQGTALVQLGAFETADIAAAEWDRLTGRFAEYVVGKERVIQEAVSGGRTFYRLRAMGFAGLDDARRFCAVLVAEDAGCVPVVVE